MTVTAKMTEACIAMIHALNNTPADYMASTLAQRNPGPNAAGSYWDEPQTLGTLMSADWEETQDPAVGRQCKAYKAPISGWIGALPIADLADDTPVRFVPAHGGAVEGMEVQANLSGMLEAAYTLAIVGDHEGKQAVYTLHPGPALPLGPIILREQVTDLIGSWPGTDRLIGTVGEAKRLGFKTVKHAIF